MEEIRLHAIHRRFARVISGIAIAAGALALAGWFSGWRGVPGAAAWLDPNPLAALLFVLCGLALLRFTARQPGARVVWTDYLAWSAAVLAALGGLVALVDAFTPGIEVQRLLFNRWLLGSEAPGLNHCVGMTFLLYGTGLALADSETKRGIRPAQWFVLTTGFIGLVALIGYVYGVEPLYTMGGHRGMAVSTALLFAALSLAALAARPDRGMMRVMTSDTTGGAMARRLLPAAVLIPLILGVLRLLGERHGYFANDLGMALVAIAIVVLFVALIWCNARLLFVAESERKLAERRLAMQYGATRVLAEALTLPEATGKLLKAIGEALDWRSGALWLKSGNAELLRCVDWWSSAPAIIRDFAEQTRNSVFGPGVGFPGRVWSDERPLWIEDVRRDPNFTRQSSAAKAGLRTAVGFPIRCDQSTCGVMEFFSDRIEPPDDKLLPMLAVIGSQTGRFIERQNAEERLRIATADLERSNTDLQQFAYVASHDLSEPLRMVISYLQLLTERHADRLEPEAREFIGYAVDGAQRMRGLISDLLAYARVDTRGRSFEAVNCEQVVDAVCANLKLTIEETGTVIEREPLPTVQGDSVQLTQVFQNLVGNAIKFRGHEPPRIQIGARRADREWVFYVSDNGIGIDPRNFERIFVLFQRLHTRQEYPGTGMGLAICKKILERHGGRIWVQSAPGQGAMFCFTLPDGEAGPVPGRITTRDAPKNSDGVK